MTRQEMFDMGAENLECQIMVWKMKGKIKNFLNLVRARSVLKELKECE